MRRSVRLAALLAWALVTPAFGSSAAADDRDQVPSQPLLEGKQVFAAKGCGRCHGDVGAAAGPHGSDLGRGQPWRDFMQLAGALWNHTPAMLEETKATGVERATLSPREFGQVAGYLLYLNFLDETGDVERGREVFTARSCARCHQLAGRGGTIGPRLDELGPYASSVFLAQTLWNHGPQMTAKMTELALERPRLEDDDVANLVAFIRGAGRPALSPEESASQLGSPRAGKVVFADKGCANCHGVGGRGGAIGPDLGAGRARRHVGQIAAALWNHGPRMWARMRTLGIPFPVLDGPQTADLLAYLYFIQYMDERGDPVRGAALFRDKSCAGCHAPADGAAVGPDLTRSDAARSPLRWAAAMWSHAPAMAQKMRQQGSVWPHFADDEMRDLVAFIRTQRRDD